MTTLQAPDGTPIHHTDHGGDGPNVLLVHGITESSAVWDPIVDRLVSDRRVVTLDLRGHGRSGTADRYDLEVMAGDVVAVAEAMGMLGAVHLVGHSLGGAVASAVAAAAPVTSVVNVDQSLRLGGFKAQLAPAEAMLRDPTAFPAAIGQLFDDMAGPLPAAERERVGAIRSADQTVVLGVWDVLFTSTEAEIDAVVEAVLAGFAGRPIPYLSLFGIDPGSDYDAWLSSHLPGAVVERWPDHGHYPHLVDPDRFVDRLRLFWG